MKAKRHKRTLATLLEGDCLKLMEGELSLMEPKENLDRHFDLVVADLPFGLTRNAWDENLPFDRLSKCLKELAKPTATFLFFCVQPYTTMLANDLFKHGLKFRYDLVWQKKNNKTGFLNANKMPMRSHENILVAYRQPGYYFPQKIPGPVLERRTPRYSSNYGAIDGETSGDRETRTYSLRHPGSVLEFAAVPNGRGSRSHPTEKPVNLLAWLIRAYCPPGGWILDPTAGSGSTGLAALQTRRNCVLIESDARYCAIARKRLEVAGGAR